MAQIQLEPDKIIETAHILCRRIKERFPDAGLGRVCERLLDVAKQARVRAAEIAAPILWVRLLSAAVSAGIIAVFVGVAVRVKIPDQPVGAGESLQVLEAGLNALVLVGATIIFLVTLELRIKRRKALRAVHELRVISHIIDMHQLTKDPEVLRSGGPATQSSPRRTMNTFELNRYLDYCSEMLAITGKIAALYIQNFEDAAAVAAVNDIEELTSGLQRKIWQKIMILHAGSGKEPR